MHLAGRWEAGGSAVGTIIPRGCGQNGKNLENRNKDEEGSGEGSLLEKAEGLGLLVLRSREAVLFAVVFGRVKNS